MKFHDSHCHLAENYFFNNIKNYMEEWTDQGLEYVIGVSTKLTDTEKIIELSKRYEKIIPTIGIHPWQAKEDLSNKEEEQILKHLKDINRIVIGEIGLDHYFIKKSEYYQIQENIFRFFLEIAEREKIPINIHLKGAEKEVLQTIEEYKINPKNILVHWYSGPKEVMYEFKRIGTFFSINPSVFTGSTHINVLKDIPIEQLLTESDGNVKYTIGEKRVIGSPSLVPQILKKISSVKDISIGVVEKELSKNFKKYTNR